MKTKKSRSKPLKPKPQSVPSLSSSQTPVEGSPDRIAFFSRVSTKVAALGVLVIVTFLVYWPSLQGKPFLDDYSAIFDNPQIKTFDYVGHQARFFYVSRGWVQISFALDWWAYSGAFWGMHLTNILLHIVAALLVWVLVRQLFHSLPNGNETTSLSFYQGLAAAFFFALHPINTQAVSYVIARADVMATLFYLVGMYLSVRWITQLPSGSVFSVRSLFLLSKIVLVTLLCTGLGLGAKEIAITLPAMVLVFVILCKRKESFRTILSYLGVITLPFVILAVVYLSLRIFVFGSALGFSDAQARPPLVNLMTQAGVVVLYYFPRIVLPVNLLFDPDFDLIPSITDGRFMLSMLVLIFIAGVALRCFKNKPLITFGILWFFITLAPTSTLIPLWDIIAERRIYLPSVGIALIFEVALMWLSHRKAVERKVLVPACAAIFLLLGALTVQRNRDYTDPIRFWQQEFESSSTKPRVIRNLLHAYIQQNRMEEAKQLFLTLDWKNFDIQNSIRKSEDLNFILRFMLSNQFQIPEAVRMAEALAELYPKDPDVLNTLQIAYLRTEQNDKAEQYVDLALKISPKHLDSMLNKAYLLSVKNDTQKTMEWLQKTVQLHPNSIEALDQLIRYTEYLGQDAAELKKRMQQLQSQRDDSNPSAVYTLE